MSWQVEIENNKKCFSFFPWTYKVIKKLQTQISKLHFFKAFVNYFATFFIKQFSGYASFSVNFFLLFKIWYFVEKLRIYNLSRYRFDSDCIFFITERKNLVIIAGFVIFELDFFRPFSFSWRIEDPLLKKDSKVLKSSRWDILLGHVPQIFQIRRQLSSQTF